MTQVARVLDHRHRFSRGGVGQAQEGHVGRVQQPRALGRVLALVRVDAEDVDVVTGGQHLADLQPGSAFLPVHVHAGHGIKDKSEGKRQKSEVRSQR